MCPPSSGNSGSRLKTPTKKFRLASTDRKAGDLAALPQFATDAAGADHADRGLRVTLAAGDRGPQLRHLLRELLQPLERTDEDPLGLTAGEAERGGGTGDRAGVRWVTPIWPTVSRSAGPMSLTFLVPASISAWTAAVGRWAVGMVTGPLVMVWPARS